MSVLIVSIFSVLGFWLGRYIVLRVGKCINTQTQESNQREDERCKEAVRRGVAEYLEAKKDWEEKGDNHVS